MNRVIYWHINCSLVYLPFLFIVIVPLPVAENQIKSNSKTNVIVMWNTFYSIFSGRRIFSISPIISVLYRKQSGLFNKSYPSVILRFLDSEFNLILNWHISRKYYWFRTTVKKYRRNSYSTTPFFHNIYISVLWLMAIQWQLSVR